MEKVVLKVIGRFVRSEQGQDLAEYCMITALVALFACALFVKVSGGIQNIWGTANTTLAAEGSSTGSGAVASSSDAR